MNNDENIWFKVLTLFEKTNHLVKEGNWYEEDVSDFYLLKDQFLDFIIKAKPEPLKLNLYYIPYYKFSSFTKDKAGRLMRADKSRKPFEHYLSLVEPSEHDIEISEKATIEIEVQLDLREFSFHIPKNKTSEWYIDIDSLPKKTWISGKEFHRKKYRIIRKELLILLEQIT